MSDATPRDEPPSSEAGCLRSVHFGQVAFAFPVEIIHNGPAHVALGQTRGSIGLVPQGWPADREGFSEQARQGPLDLVLYTWDHTHMVRIFVPGQWWSTRLMWSADTGDFVCWYIDFVRPIHVHGSFYDMRDLALDIVIVIVIVPDRTWSWKDEDEYGRKVASGIIDAEEREQVEAARPAAIDVIERSFFPLDGSYLDWTPSPVLPELPADPLA